MTERGRPRTELIWLASALVLAVFLGSVFALESTLKRVVGRASDSGVTLRITSPLQNSIVTSPVTLRVESSGIEIAPPEAGVADAAHYHAFINRHPFTPVDNVIPVEDDDVIYFATDEIEIDLEPGRHTIIVALGDNDHVRLRDAPARFVDFTVE